MKSWSILISCSFTLLGVISGLFSDASIQLKGQLHPLIIFFVSAIILFILLAFQRLINKKGCWKIPSWKRMIFQFNQPLLIFFLIALFFIGSGLGAMASNLISNTLVFFAIGCGLLCSVYTFCYIFKIEK